MQQSGALQVSIVEYSIKNGLFVGQMSRPEVWCRAALQFHSVKHGDLSHCPLKPVVDSQKLPVFNN